MKIIKIILTLWSIMFVFSNSIAQSKFTISGYVKDATTGETLIGANIFDLNNPINGAISNIYGFYSLTLPEGNYSIVYSYLGYNDHKKTLQLSQNVKNDIFLDIGVFIEEVVITAERKDKNVSGTEMGTISLPIEKIKKLPTLLGEVDVLKALQLLPGVLSAGGSTGFHVRGGGPDQNLILLDEAIVYNSGHLLGFFSIFNADALKNTTLIKGGIPAQYGGRLSSVVDIQMKDGNNQNYEILGGIGTIASRLTIQGPIQTNKSSFIVSGRRTYAGDAAQSLLKDSNFKGSNYFFYDLNAKANFYISKKDKIFFSGYLGRDKFTFKSKEGDYDFHMPYGNTTATVRWNHLFSGKIFVNTSIIYNDYNFNFDASQAEFSLKTNSGIQDYNAKTDFYFFPNTSHSIKAGANYTFHTFLPNNGIAEIGETEFINNNADQYRHEAAIYIEDEYKIHPKWTVNYGIRASAFIKIGKYISTINGKKYKKGQEGKTYQNLEPRLNVNYSLNKAQSIKGGITFNNQYAHLVSNSTNTLPIDVWIPSSPIIKPQKSIQYALGYFRNLKNNQYETSVEIYYKDLKNQIDYREDYVQNLSLETKNEFVFGKGKAYGAEFFIKKNTGKLTGWIGYTIARSERIFKEINNGNVFPSSYDRIHDLSIVTNYKLSDKWNFSAVFIYGTAKAYTPITGLYLIENKINIRYGARNSKRLDPYHRIDLSATYNRHSNSNKWFSSSWSFSIYNVYNQKNPFFNYFYFKIDAAKETTITKGYKVTIFPIIPSISWNFKVKRRKDQKKIN